MPGEVRDPTGPNTAALVISARGIPATDLNALVGLEPDRSWDEDEPVGSTGRGRRQFTGWRIDASRGDETADSRVRSLLHRVHDVAADIARVARDPRIHSVSLWVWSEDPEFALNLPADLVMEIARLGASLKIKVYDVSTDGPQE